MAPRRRDRRSRPQYPSIGVLSDPTSVERLALAIAATVVGELTARDRKIAVAIAHEFSGTLIDFREANDELATQVLELRRLWGDTPVSE